MPVYAYTLEPGPRQAGLSRGTITADSPRQARDQLRSGGRAVSELVEQNPRRRGSGPWRYLAARQNHRATTLLQEMATLLRAGIPLLEALDTITRQHSGPFRKSILLLHDQVASGASLAQAMALQPDIFDPLCASIVEVGENAGTLDTALDRLVDFRRRSAGLKNRLASAMIYPAIVLGVGVAVSLFLMTFVAPNLLGVLAAAGRQPPLATRVVKAISDALLGWWWLMLPSVAVVLAAGGIAMLRTDRGREHWDHFVLRLPVVGDLVRKQMIARLAMVLAALLDSGVVFVRAVEVSRRTVHNRVLRRALAACEEAVLAGRDIATALERTRAFPPLVIQVFAVGQASGRLGPMLAELAGDYDKQVDIAAGRLTALLEPLLMILLAIVVGFIAFATILPILEAGDVLQRAH